MERSYGYLSNFFQKKHFFITHIRDLHYKGLDVPTMYIVLEYFLELPVNFLRQDARKFSPFVTEIKVALLCFSEQIS